MELASILLRQGKIDEARVQYRDLLTRKNISTKLFLNANFSLCRIGLEKKDQALSYAWQGVKKFQAAIKISDKNPWFYYHAGMTYQKMENKPKAVENYKIALDLLKDTPAKDFKIQIKKLIAQCHK